jgi:hypothetical protein
MPTILRAVVFCTALAALGFAALWLLANVLEPAQREIVIQVPPTRYAP